MSVTSFNSDQLEDDYDTAPWNISTNHPQLGTVVVAKSGDTLPLISKYKTFSGCDTAISFYVDKNLEVKVHKERKKPVKMLASEKIYDSNNSVEQNLDNSIVLDEFSVPVTQSSGCKRTHSGNGPSSESSPLHSGSIPGDSVVIVSQDSQVFGPSTSGSMEFQSEDSSHCPSHVGSSQAQGQVEYRRIGIKVLRNF